MLFRSLPGYAELHCRSNFSFLSGASQPEELVARAQALGYCALALADECSLSGSVRAHGEAERLQMRLIVGTEMQLTAPAAPAAAPALSPARPAEPRLVLLVQSRRGYSNLVQWITHARRRAPKGEYRAHRSDIEGRIPTAPMLAGLPGCFALLLPDPASSFEALFNHAMWLKTWFGTERAAIAVELRYQPHSALQVSLLTRLAAATGLPLVAAGGVRMHTRSRKPLLDVLTATRLKCTVAEAGLALQPNAEAHLRSRVRLASL